MTKHRLCDLFKNKMILLREELLFCGKIMSSPRNFWIYIPIAIAFIVTYAAHGFGATAVLHKGINEVIGVLLIALVSLILMAAAFASRGAFAELFFSVLAFNFLIRELDDTKWRLPIFGEFSLRTKEYIYLALTIMALWAFYKIDSLVIYFRKRPLTEKIFIGMTSCYVLSQLVARRFFRHIIPDEGSIHIALEEISENFAHICFLILAILVARYAATARWPQKEENNP